MLADYVLQTNWVASGKSNFEWTAIETWRGLLLHGLTVWLVSLAVIPSYLGILWPYITLMAVLHTFQDAIKVSISRHLAIHPFVTYAFDQLLHVILILVLNDFFPRANLIVPPPPRAEVHLMMLGAALVAVTRFYEVSWWANWLDMLPYMKRWQIWGYAERCAMLLLSALGYWWIAPLAVLPRLYVAWKEKHPIWHQKRGMIELLLGAAFSVILGGAFY